MIQRYNQLDSKGMDNGGDVLYFFPELGIEE